MKIIGLTGQTGAGKSTVCQKLISRGFYHIDADKIARTLTDSGSPVVDELRKSFGDGIMNSDGSVNRKELAKEAFSSPDKTLLLNSITHPVVTEKIRDIIKQQENAGTKAVLIDAIALFESGEDELCDFTVAVVAPMEIRLDRIMKRDGISEQPAMLRINAQKDESYYCTRADYTIENYPPYDLDEEIKGIFEHE